ASPAAGGTGKGPRQAAPAAPLAGPVLQWEAGGTTSGRAGEHRGPPLAAGANFRGRCGVSFSEQPPSKQWAALKYGGEKLAEVWFKPEGEPFALTFRIPRESFDIPGIGQRLTTESLLKAVAVAADEVESWRHEGVSHSGTGGPDPELRHALPPPPQGVAHLTIHVSLKPP